MISGKIFYTLTSTHIAVSGLTKSWSSKRIDSRQRGSKMEQEGLQRGQRPKAKENDD